MMRRSYQLNLAVLLVPMLTLLGCGTNQIDGLADPGVGGSGGQIGPGFDGGGFACGEKAGMGSGSFTGSGPAMRVGPMAVTSPTFDGIASADDAPPPVSGGSMVVLRDGTTVVAADGDRDRVYIVDLSTTSLAKLRVSIPLMRNDQPGRVVEDAAGHVHVILRRGGGVVSIDPVAGKVTMRRSVCALPRGLAYDGVADRLLVACAGGELVTFTPTGATPERTIKLQNDLRDVVVDGSRVMVTRFRSAETIVLDNRGSIVELIRPVAFNSPAVQGGTPFAPSVAWKTVAMPDGGAMMIHQRGMSGKVRQTPGGYGGLSPCDTIVHTSVTRMRAGEKPSPGPAMPGFVLPVDVAVSGDGKQVAMIAAGNGHANGNARKLFVADVDDVSREWEGGCGMDDKHGPTTTPICGSKREPRSVPPAPDGSCPMGFVLCHGL
ncbi:MAG: hypothetical protein H7X95_08265, partial [Deltaproteobacteria bacterium]|nr:hypothetical protein [Deltaproteobacteria bacterium]